MILDKIEREKVPVPNLIQLQGSLCLMMVLLIDPSTNYTHRGEF